MQLQQQRVGDIDRWVAPLVSEALSKVLKEYPRSNSKSGDVGEAGDCARSFLNLNSVAVLKV